MVIETLKEVAPERRCFRMVGGVLVERTVGDVLPALSTNKEQVRLRANDSPVLRSGFYNHCKHTGYLLSIRTVDNIEN